MAALGLPVVVVPILGPVLSGLIVSNVSWRWIFFVNVPMCVLAMVPAWPGPEPGRRTRAPPPPWLDVAGLLCPTLTGLLYGLARVNSADGFGHLSVLGPVFGGAILLAGFVLDELRMAGEPVVDLRLFRSRAFTGASALMFLAGLSIYGANLLMPLYLQQARGYSALAAGLLLVPQGIGSILPRTIVGKLTDRLGPRPVTVTGVILAGLGTIPFAVAGPHTSVWLLGAGLVVRDAGLGAATIALMAGPSRACRGPTRRTRGAPPGLCSSCAARSARRCWS